MVTPSPRIAIVDDDAAVRNALTRLLRSAHYHVSTFSSVEDFLDTLHIDTPACLLMDYQMPKMTGLDLQTELQQSGFSIPVIIITAHDEAAIRKNCINSGSAAFLAKPVSKTALLAAIRHALKS